MTGFEVANGVLTLRDDAGATLLRARGAVEIATGPRPADSTRVLQLAQQGSAPDGPDADVRWHVEREGDHGLRVRLSVRNATSTPLRVERLLPLVAESGYRALPVDALRMSQTGWQSWSRPHPARAWAPNAERAPPPIRAPYLPLRHPGGMVSPWMSVLRADDAPGALLLGFTTARRLTGVVEVAPAAEGHWLAAWADAEAHLLQPGQALDSEPLLVLWGAEQPIVEAYADAVAAEMGARRPATIPTGWCSWYEFGARVTEQDVHRNLRSLVAHRETLPLQVVQVDDGYATATGDWLSTNRATFPAGLCALAEAIRASGLAPGVWIAPFLVSECSAAYAAHPDWVVRGEDGTPLNAIYNWGSANYALDTTHPAALAWLEEVIRTFTREWGFNYLKLDFVYAAALRGQRADPDATGVEAYRRGMQAIRRVAGDEVFLLGCGAPLLPSVGLVDGMRIGSDVATEWCPAGSEDGGPALLNALRSTLVRGWMHRRWWLNDPDCVLVREHDSALTLDEVRAWASVVALSGGMAMLGDDLSRLPPERLAILRRLLPPSGRAAHAFGPLVDDTPQRARLETGAAGEAVVALGNWHAAPRAAHFDPAEWGLAPEVTYNLTDLWAGTHHGPHRGVLDLGLLPPHGLRLLAVSTTGTPPAVDAGRHLLGPALAAATPA